MVDRTNLSEVNDLYQEMTAIEQAIINFDAGGQIVQMTVSGISPDAHDLPYQQPWVSVPTTHISYPPQMVQAIKAALEDRRKELEARLDELGLTGIGEEDVARRGR